MLAERWPTSSQERPASSDAAWSSGCWRSARARSTCSCARAPRAALDDLIERWSMVAGASAAERVAARDRRPAPAAAGRREGAGRRAARQDRALLPPRRRLRHDRAGRAQHGGQRRRHDPRGRTRARGRRQAPAPRLLDRRRRHLQGRVRRGHVRRGPAAALALSPHQVRVRADRARAAVRALARVPAGDRRRRLAAPARWTRSTARTTSSRRSSGCASCCPSGCRWWASTSATPTSCPSTGSRARSSTSRTSPTSTAARSTSPTRARSASTS